MPKKTDTKQDIYRLFQETSQSLVSFVNAFVVSNPVKPAKFHKWFSDMLLKRKYNVAVEAYRQSAKRQPLDAMVLTPDGFKCMGDIHVGDYVIGSDGKPKKVIYESPIVKRKVYKVITSDGRQTECDGEHLWAVRKMTSVKNKHVVLITEDIIKSGLYYERKKYGKNKIYREYKFAIPLVKPVAFKYKELSVHPYVLGSLIGNGSFSSSVVLHFDYRDKDFYVRQYKDLGYNISDVYCKKNSNSALFRVRGVRHLFAKLNLIGHTAKYKFIPKQYLHGSIKQRIDLLRGLMDTDGTIGKNGTVSYTTVSERLANDVVFLVRSLGGIAKKVKQITKYRGKNYLSYRIHIRFVDLNPFLISRKKDRYDKYNKTFVDFVDIVDIVEMGEKEGKCIKIDSEDGLYVTDDFILTHNTSYVVYGFPLYCLTFPHPDRSYIVLLKASDDLAKQKLHDIRDMYLQNKLLSANVQKIYQQGEVLDILTKEQVRIRIEAYGKGTNIRGLSWQTKRPDIVIMDDVQTIEDVRSQTIAERDWEWFLSDVYMLSKASRIFMIGNNLGDRCVIERLSRNAEQFGFRFFRIPALKDGRSTWSEMFTTQELLAERDAYRKANKLDVWLRERMCQSVAEETRIFKREYLQYFNTLPKDRYNYYTGVDLAVSTSRKADYTAICTIAVNSQNQRFIVDISYGRWLVDEIMKHIFEHVAKYKPLAVKVEKVAFQSVMEQLLKKEMLRKNVFFNIQMVRPVGKKEDRIKSLQPLYAANAVWHKQNASWLTELENELIMFEEAGTKAEHDDLLDALWLANYEAQAPVVRNVVKQNKARMI